MANFHATVFCCGGAGNDTQPSSSSATPWKCHVPTIPHSVPIIRPTTPKSPVFADMEGSDEEDHVLENEDVQNYIMDEVMGLAGVDSEAAAAHGSEHADELVSDGMVRLACGNNLLTSEPTLLRQRLKVLLYPSNSLALECIKDTKSIAAFSHCLQRGGYHHHHTTSLCLAVWDRKMSRRHGRGHQHSTRTSRLDLPATNPWRAS